MARKSLFTDEFWEDVNNIAISLVGTNNFYSYWSLEEKYAFMNGLKSYVYDKVALPLQNRNTVRKIVKQEHLIVLYLEDWFEINHKGFNPEKISFKDWFYNQSLKVYRGLPSSRLNKEQTPKLHIEAGQFKSATFDIEIAKRFTQPGWARRAIGNKELRTGWIIVGSIKPCDVHLYSSIGSEFECVIKGEFTFDEVVTIEKNEIVS